MRVAFTLGLVALGLVPAATSPLCGQHPPDSLDQMLRQVRTAAAAFASTDSALRRSYIQLRPVRRIPGLNPFVGEHWFNPRWLRLTQLDPGKPAYLMYYPIEGSERLVGVGYAFSQPSGAPPPSDFAGATPQWHLHHPCGGLPGLGSLLLGGADECRALGGKPGTTQIVMLHVWLEPNPDGVFGSENPALPFLATSLTPPDSAAFADPDRSTALRELGLALAETIGARPRYGTMSEFGPDSARFRTRADPLRAALRLLADSLRTAERNRDRAAYDRGAAGAVGAWRKLWQLYLDLAPGPVARRLMERWFEAVLMPGHGPGH